MSRHRQKIIFLAVLTVSIFFLIDSDAEASDYLIRLKARAKEGQLYQNRMWLALGNYRKNRFFGGYVSEADHPAFFFRRWAQLILRGS